MSAEVVTQFEFVRKPFREARRQALNSITNRSALLVLVAKTGFGARGYFAGAGCPAGTGVAAGGLLVHSVTQSKNV